MRIYILFGIALAACGGESADHHVPGDPSASGGGIRGLVPPDPGDGLAALGDAGAADAGVVEGQSGSSAAPPAGGGGGGAAGAAAGDSGGGAGSSGAASAAGAAGSAAGSGGSSSSSCTGTIYPDLDHDGYGDRDQAVIGCTAGGMVKVGGDCDDTDALVHPEQPKRFDVPRADGSFDYDCDGLEAGNDELGLCPDTSGPDVVPGSEGWVEVCAESTASGCSTVMYEAPPACGEDGSWKTNAAACPGMRVTVKRKCN